MKTVAALLLLVAVAAWIGGGNAIYFRACARAKVSPWPTSAAAWRSLTGRDQAQLGVLAAVSISIAALAVWLISA